MRFRAEAFRLFGLKVLYSELLEFDQGLECYCILVSKRDFPVLT